MTAHFIPQRPVTMGSHKDDGYVAVHETVVETSAPREDESLTPAELAEDARANHAEAVHALARRCSAPDKSATARNIVDMLLNDGLDENDVSIIATLMRGDVFSRAAAARRIERLTAAEKPAGAGKMGLSIPDTDRVVPRFTETDRS